MSTTMDSRPIFRIENYLLHKNPSHTARSSGFRAALDEQSFVPNCVSAMFNSVLRFFRFRRRHSRTPRILAEERRGHFFSWFNLEPDGEPKLTGRDTCLSFRPSGAAFHALVRLEVMVRSGDQIAGSELWVNRSFIDGMQSSFARDIVAGFLGWALKDEDVEAKNMLIASIGDMSAANEPVITRGNAVPGKHPTDRSGGYDVFMGRRDRAKLAFDGAVLTLRNGTSDDHSLKWLTINVRSKSNDHAS